MKVWFFLKQNYHIGLLTFGSLLVVGMSYFVAYIACQRSIVYHYNNITGEEESRILESLGIPRSAAFDIEANGRLRDYNSLFGFSPLNENRKEYIRAYWLPCSDEKLEVKSRPTVLYLIGQKGNISFCLPNALRWGPELNVNILMVSYRGFGFSKSEGYPTQASIVADSQTALDFLYNQERFEINVKSLCVYGVSLGGSIGMHLVAQNLTRVKALVIENTFLSLRNLIVSSDRIARLFFSPSIFDQWDTRAQLESIIRSESGLKPYILFIIGEKDTMINPSHTLELYDIALNSTHAALTKKIVFPSGGHHNDRQHNYHGQINTFLLETLT